MGDAQSAQREDKKDAAAEEESGKVDDAQTGKNIEDKTFKNNGQISEINGKADDSIAEVNGHFEDEIAAEAILLPGADVSETAKPLKEEQTTLDNVEINVKESSNDADANDVPLEMTEMDAKQNDINKGFRRIFSNIGLKLTVKKGSSEIATAVPDKTNTEEPNRPEAVEDTTKENAEQNAEQNTDVNIAPETYDSTCPSLTDLTSEGVLENAEEKTTETKKEVESENTDAATTSPVGENAYQDTTPEKDSTSPSSPEDEVVISPVKKFFTTGIFSGLWKKKKPGEDETTEQTVQEEQQDEEEISPGVEAAVVEAVHEENELKDEILSAASAQTTNEGKSLSKDISTIVTEPEILSSQEKEKVPASPLKRLLSGSSLKKLSKMQRSRKSSDAKLSDSAEPVSDHPLPSTESAENQKEECPAQPSTEAVVEEDGAWASFKKLVTPKRRMMKTNEETQIPGLVEEPKPSGEEQISDHSTEEGKKRKDSTVSWEAVLCGSGRRRSRKTSDSEDETPQIDINGQKQDEGSKHGAESPLESSNENENEMDGGSTWKSLKRLVTPKRKAKDEDESKDNIQSDSEVTQDESSFSIKKLLPGRKKRKSAEKQDQVSSDEADRDVPSGDEDSETPAVVPLSEFDIVETEVYIQTQADIENLIPEEANYELQQDLLDEMAKPVLPCDSLQTEANEVQDNDTLEKQASPTLATNEEPDDLTESDSKHQQLSDIPEEGIITETMATPALVIEEAARDDTIAEDLIEITSEAITAPEPETDITLADETEMISAVSQLSSESSKTSGNTTPVPAEYSVMETDTLLHQVFETISISPKEALVCTDELISETIAGSVSHQILETFVKEDPTILEMHRQLDATVLKTGLNVEELEAIDELAAESQRENISEVNACVSTEAVPEVAIEEFNTAEIVVDEIQEVTVTHPEESVKELERKDESHDLVELLSEINSAMSTEVLPEVDEIAVDVGSVIEAHEAETEPPKIDSQDADSATNKADETKDEAMEQQVQTETEKEDQIMHIITDQIPIVDKNQPEEQVATLDSEGSVQPLDKEVISEDISAAETVTYELKGETVPLTEANVESEKEDELETDAAKTENIQLSGASEAVEASTLDSEGSVQPLDKEVISEDISAAETVTCELKGETVPLTEANVEPEKEDELETDAAKTENIQLSGASEAVEASTLDSEESSVLSLKKEVKSEDIPTAETVRDESKKENELRDEPEEKLPVEAAKTEDAQEPEILPSDVEDIVTETKTEEKALMHVEEVETAMPLVKDDVAETAKEGSVVVMMHVPSVTCEDHRIQVEVVDVDVKLAETIVESALEVGVTEAKVTQSIEGGAEELEMQILLEDIPKPETNNLIASVKNEIESEVVTQLDQALENTEDRKTETIPKIALLEQEDHILETVDNLQTLTAVHASVNEQASNVQLLGQTVFAEEIPTPSVENASATDEPKHEVQLSAVQVSVEREKESELPGTEKKMAAVEHAVVAQVVVCNLKDVSVAIPDVLIEKTTQSTEPLINIMASEQVLREEVETAMPLVKDDVAETAKEGSVVVMMHVPSVTCEDHRIQVEVVDVDVKLAETIVESALEVGVTEAIEVIDVCHETIKKVENLSATAKTEEEIINEKNKVFVEEKLPETAPESLVVSLKQEVIKQPEDVTIMSEMVKSESNETMEDSIRTFMERQDTAPSLISDNSATEQQVSVDLMHTPDIPGSLDVSVHDQKTDLEGHKAQWEKSEDVTTAEEVKSSSEELDVIKIHDQAQITQIAPSQIAASSNTGIISSTGNVESPSSLSLEFKLNIQFGQAKAPASPPPTTEIIAPLKQTDVAKAVEVVEPVKPINPTQSTKSQKQTELTVQATENTKPVENLIMTQPALLHVGIQAMETVEPGEQIKSTESVQPIETTQPVQQTAKTEEVSEACDQETKAEEPVKQIEEENEQDVWMDAEEVICTQEETEVSFLEVEEPLEPQTASEEDEKAELGHEVEMAPNSKTEEEEGEQEIPKTGGASVIESEDEDFAVALEHPETAAASVTTMEWD